MTRAKRSNRKDAVRKMLDWLARRGEKGATYAQIRQKVWENGATYDGGPPITGYMSTSLHPLLRAFATREGKGPKAIYRRNDEPHLGVPFRTARLIAKRKGSHDFWGQNHDADRSERTRKAVAAIPTDKRVPDFGEGLPLEQLRDMLLFRELPKNLIRVIVESLGVGFLHRNVLQVYSLDCDWTMVVAKGGRRAFIDKSDIPALLEGVYLTDRGDTL